MLLLVAAMKVFVENSHATIWQVIPSPDRYPIVLGETASGQRERSKNVMMPFSLLIAKQVHKTA